MLKIKKLRIENLGRFVGLHEINFEQKSNFIQVDAENHNTGGSSGGGKSSIFSAIEYVLGLNSTPATVLQSRLTKNHLCVELEIDKDGQSYIVGRNKNSGLYISGPDKDVSGSSKKAEDELNDLLGIPGDLLRPMIHKRQGEGGFFLSKTPAKCHEFMMECLGMNSLEKKIDKIDTLVGESNKELITSKAELSSNEFALSSAKDILLSLLPPKCEVDENVLMSLSERISSLKTIRDNHHRDLTNKMNSLGTIPGFSYSEDPRLTAAIQAKELEMTSLNSSLMEFSNRIANLNSTITVDGNHVDIYRNAISNKDSVTQELESLKVQITESLKKMCPTCKQDLKDEHASHAVAAPFIEKAQKKKLELDSIVSMEEKLPILLDNIFNNKKQLSECVESKKQIESQIISVRSDLSIFIKAREDAREKAAVDYKAVVELMNNDKKNLMTQYEPLFADLDSQLEAYNQAYYKGQASLKAYQDSMKQYESQKASVETKLLSLKNSIEEGKTKVESLTKKVSIGTQALKFLKSYTNQLFQESLSVVADTATKILSRIPNMNTATITFDAYKETQDGKIKEEVVAILSLDDEINVPVRSMSGGERAAVDLAVDLAVIDMIESRTGNGLDLFILDEPFDGLDAVCRENCLEVLKNHASDRKIIIVDHSTETKQMVQDKILVIREGQTSRICDSI